jgi:hypothetical protein
MTTNPAVTIKPAISVGVAKLIRICTVLILRRRTR